jgi:hypothetical protein
MPSAKSKKKQPLQRRAGRPDTGIRKGFARLDSYVEPALRDALDRIADRQTQRSGQNVSRTDVVRAALEAYVREHLPNAKI